MTNFDDIAAELQDASNPELPRVSFHQQHNGLIVSSFKLPCGDEVYASPDDSDAAVTFDNVQEFMTVVCEAIILHTPFERVLYSMSGGREPFKHIPMSLNDSLSTIEDFLKYLVENTVIKEFGSDAVHYRVMPRLIQVGSIVGLIARGRYCGKSDWPNDKAEIIRMAQEAQLRAMHLN